MSTPNSTVEGVIMFFLLSGVAIFYLLKWTVKGIAYLIIFLSTIFSRG